MMTSWALVPVKRLRTSKMRLTPVLSPAMREALALAMLRDVLTVLTKAHGFAGVAVVTADPAAMRVARSYGALILTEGADEGYNEAVRAGSLALQASGVEAVLTLPLDLPLVTQREVEEIVEYRAGAETAFAIAPSRDRLGTNAALRAPPDCVPFLYGADSFVAHCDAARRAGIAPRICELPGIALDIDAPADLEALGHLSRRTHAGRLVGETFVVRREQECSR
jgi:2-phospho-L-lactate/phosphoenolpyruvate guanylyltransferase